MALSVLVVDDDPVILRLLQVNFELEGIGVVLAVDGEEGLKLAQTDPPEKNRALSLSPSWRCAEAINSCFFGVKRVANREG